jgi:hypothetical protein
VVSPASAYTEREAVHRGLRDEARLSGSRLSAWRSVTFLAAFGCVVAWEALRGAAGQVALALALLLVVTFWGLVVRHRAVRARERREEVLRALNAQGLLRLDRRWDELAASSTETPHGGEPASPDHPFAADLHLFGSASLFALAGPVTTAPGRTTLRTWLLDPAAPPVVEARQAAVAELAPALDFRQELSALGRLADPSPEGALTTFLEWAEEAPWLAGRRGVLTASWLVPPLTVGLGLLDWLGPLGPLWLAPLVLQLWILKRVLPTVRAHVRRASLGRPALRPSGGQLRLIGARPMKAPLLRALRDRLDSTEIDAHHQLARLRRLLDWLAAQGSALYETLNVALLLDVHLYRALERWKARAGGSVRGWIEVLGQVEALSALASLAHDHPDWTYPSVDPAAGTLEARELGHPLLAPGTCVRNDVTVGPAETFLLVTGSNMSGKSTLLRALGSNVALASAGGPVCASDLRLPPVRLRTSMLVGDSLTDGVSRFMAELLRMKSIVEAATHVPSDPGEGPVLYLLDEILQGTNSAERRVAARAVVRHLLEAGALGAVSTHDLALHESEDLQSRARAFHFREGVEREEGRTRLTFDFRLRPGLATTRNALRLLEAVGLGRGDA